MDLEDLPSDSDTEDEDYCPVQDSGSESLDEKNDLSEHEEDGDTTKSKKKRKKVRKTRNNHLVNNEDEVEESKTVVDPEAEKKRVEALWADFVSSTEIHIDPNKNKSNRGDPTKSNISKKNIPKIQNSSQSTALKIFEFAGEAIEVSQNGSSSSSLEKSPENIVPVKTVPVPTNSLGLKRPTTGGLSTVLNQLSKKNKLSVLEKTKLDWDGFKSNEGISEQLKTHNRGRNGFLERRDFLERTDLRQFEIEKSIRTSSKRSK